MKKGVLFDFDGVTVKSMEQHFSAWKNAFAERGIELKEEDFFILEGQGIREISAALVKLYKLSENEIGEIVEQKVEYYNQSLKVEFYDHFFDMLKVLKDRKLKIGVVTGGTMSRVGPIIKSHFNGSFDCVVTVDRVKRGKPFPDPFLKGAELLSLEPKDCIVVENAPMGVKGAVKAGMIVIAITTTLAPSYLKNAHYIVDDFYQVENLILSLI